MRFTPLKSLFIPLAFLIMPHAVLAQTDDGTGGDFSSHDLLIETFTADESQAVKDAEAAVSDAQDAVAAAAAGSQELTDAELALTEAQDNLTAANLANDEEATLIAELVGKLSDEQVTAFNRSLNNSLHNQFPVDLNADILQAALDGEYDKIQINFLTKAYEEEAKFLSLAERFKAKAEETGDDSFLEQAERMTAKAESSKEKFLTRIDRDNMEREGQNEAARESRQASKEQGQVAREAAHEARDAAKEAAREAREAAKEAAKEAREAAKEDARENARDHAKGRNGD